MLSFAKYSHLYHGNQAECNTLKQILESLVTLRPTLERARTVMIDGGLQRRTRLPFSKPGSFTISSSSGGKSILRRTIPGP